MKLLLLTTKEKASLNFEPKFPFLIVGDPDACMYVFVYPFEMVDNWWMFLCTFQLKSGLFPRKQQFEKSDNRSNYWIVKP